MERFWYLILLFFGIAHFLHPTSGGQVKTIYDSPGTLHLNIPCDRKAATTRAIIKSNQGIVDTLLLYSRSSIDRRMRLHPNSANSKEITLEIDESKLNDSGHWSIKLEQEFNSETPAVSKDYAFDVRIGKSLNTDLEVTPGDDLVVLLGQTIFVSFPHSLGEVKSCELLSPNETLYSNFNIILQENCSLSMTVPENNSDDETWHLVGNLINGSIFKSSFRVHRHEPKDSETISLNFNHGETEEFLVEGRGIKLCVVEDPHGIRSLPFLAKPIHYRTNYYQCIQKISGVSEKHAGLWKIFYGVAGSTGLLQQNFNVSIISPHLESKIENSPNGVISLTCTSTRLALDYCMFQRPDGNLMFMSPGIGDDKYEYYGRGYKSGKPEKPQDCGVSILNPGPLDYGSWKCILGLDKETRSRGTILKVNRPNVSEFENSAVEGGIAWAKLNTSYKISCTANEVLSYCWLRSPNGTIYNVKSKRSDNFTLKYEGESLNLGECTALVESASPSDQGIWFCHVGIKNGPELQTEVDVRISRSLLKPLSAKTVVEGFKGLNLEFQALPDLSTYIMACRWISPSGVGINVGMDDRFRTSTSKNHCSLQINEVRTEDVGVWRCFARFADSDDEEVGKVTIKLRQQRLFGVVSMSLMVGVFFCATLIGLYIMFVGKNRVFNLTTKLVNEKKDSYHHKFSSDTWISFGENQKTEKITTKY